MVYRFGAKFSEFPNIKRYVATLKVGSAMDSAEHVSDGCLSLTALLCYRSAPVCRPPGRRTARTRHKSLADRLIQNCCSWPPIDAVCQTYKCKAAEELRFASAHSQQAVQLEPETALQSFVSYKCIQAEQVMRQTPRLQHRC